MIETANARIFFEVTPNPSFPIKDMTARVLNAAMNLLSENPSFAEHMAGTQIAVAGTNLEVRTYAEVRAQPYLSRSGRFEVIVCQPRSGLDYYYHCIGPDQLGPDELAKVRYTFSTDPRILSVRNTINTRAGFEGRGFGRALGWTMNRVAQMIANAYGRDGNVICKIADDSLYKGKRREWTSCLAAELGFERNTETNAEYPCFKKVI